MNALSKEQNFFLTALSDHINGKITVVPDGLDKERILKISQQQQCAGIVYYQTHFQELKTSFVLIISNAVGRKRIETQIHDVLTENNIPYLIMKGSEVAQCYPVPQLRTMGDTDILVHSEDKQKAHELLVGLGFENSFFGPNEWSYSNAGFKLELHHRLLNNEVISTPKHMKLMNSVWNNVVVDEENRFHMDWNFHLVYLLLHLRVHFISSGVGFRQFMDIAAVIKNRKIDWDAFNKTVDELHIAKFTETCFALIKKWFEVEVPINVKEPDEDFCKSATIQIFKNGVFGFDNTENYNNYTIAQMQQYNHGFWKISILLNSIFPSYDSLLGFPEFAYIKDKAWLLPIAWIHRIIKFIFSGKTKKKVNGFKSHFSVSAEEVTKREQYLKKWGIFG